MNSVLWDCLVSHEVFIPFNFEEAHPAYDEGYYAYSKPATRSRNLYEEGSDSWYEWNAGFEQAYYNYMTSGTA